MKIIPHLFIAIATLCAVDLLFSGCASTAAGAIEAASTKIEIRESKSKSLMLVLPKELETTGFHFSIDPKTGIIRLDADHLASSSQGVIDRAGNAQAQALSQISQTSSSLAGMLKDMAAAFLRTPSAQTTAAAAAPDQLVLPSAAAASPAATPPSAAPTPVPASK